MSFIGNWSFVVTGWGAVGRSKGAL